MEVVDKHPSKKICTKWIGIKPRHMMGVFCLADGGGPLIGKKDSNFLRVVNTTTHLL